MTTRVRYAPKSNHTHAKSGTHANAEAGIFVKNKRRPIKNLKDGRNNKGPEASERSPLGPIFIIFLVFYCFRLLQGGVRFAELGAIRLELILGLIAAIPALLILVTDRAARLPWCFWFGAALAALMLLMVPFSVAPTLSWKAFSEHAFKDMLIGISITTLVSSVRRLKWFLGAHLFAYAKMAQEGVLGVITGGLIWENQGTPRLHGSTPNYEHPNSFGGTQAGTVPFVSGLLGLRLVRILRLALLAQLIAALVVIVYTGSRSTYVGFSAWILVIAWQSERKFRATLVVAFLALGASLIVPHAYVERFQQIFTQKDKEGGSIEERKRITTDAMTIFIENPFGIGTGAFPAARAERFGRTQDTHNLYLEVATNLGVQGLLIFILMIWSIYWELNRLRTEQTRAIKELSKSPIVNETLLGEYRFTGAVTSGLMSFLLIRLVLGFLGHDLYEIYWWFCIGLTCSLSRITRDLNAQAQELPTQWSRKDTHLLIDEPTGRRGEAHGHLHVYRNTYPSSK